VSAKDTLKNKTPMNELSENAKSLLEQLPEDGRRITNETARRLTEWDTEKLKIAKQELKNLGLIEVKASFGGPFGRKTLNAPINRDTNNKSFASLEQDLYAPFKNWIIKEVTQFFPDGFVTGKDIFDVQVTGNKRPQGSGFWEIPDLICISYKKYKYIPNVEFNTVTFELKKKSDAFNPQGIFEAISHSKFGSRSYFCFEWTDNDDFYENDKYQRIEQEAKTHGIGLIRMYFADTEKKFIEADIILEAKQLTYDPGLLSDFIDKFLPSETKNQFIRMTNSW
jgi:hypothetical protein